MLGTDEKMIWKFFAVYPESGLGAATGCAPGETSVTRHETGGETSVTPA